MKFTNFRVWHIFALASGIIIAAVMALASISYNETLGTAELAFSWLPVTNRSVFSSLALAFDLGMIASTFGFWHWYGRSRVAAGFCVVLFAIASVFSVHSVRGYIALNITKSLAPAKRNVDVYASLKLELTAAQHHLGKLRTSLLRARGHSRSRLLREIKQQSRQIQVSRNTLAKAKPNTFVMPMTGIEWFLALCLWFFNATCWTAWFGTGIERPKTGAKHEPSITYDSCNKQAVRTMQDSVARWIADYPDKKDEHCVVLFRHYQDWCALNDFNSLSQYSFYARLIELGAKKYRDGGNGSTMYRLPVKIAASALSKGGRDEQ